MRRKKGKTNVFNIFNFFIKTIKLKLQTEENQMLANTLWKYIQARIYMLVRLAKSMCNLLKIGGKEKK